MITQEACVEQFIRDNQNRLSPLTQENYQRYIKELLNFSQKAYNELSTSDIRKWLYQLEQRSQKSSTIQTKLIAVRIFYRYCIEEGWISVDPTKGIPLPKVPDKLPVYLTHEQLASLRKIVEGNVKQRAVVEILYATGIRLGELTHIKLEHINWSERIIEIPNGKGSKGRIVLFTRGCEEWLKAYIQTRTDDLPYLFLNRYQTGPIGKRGIQYWFHLYREELGFYFTPHTLRHTFTAHLAIKGMPLTSIQLLLGHHSPKETQYYARLYQEAQKQKYDEWM